MTPIFSPLFFRANNRRGISACGRIARVLGFPESRRNKEKAGYGSRPPGHGRHPHRRDFRWNCCKTIFATTDVSTGRTGPSPADPSTPDLPTLAGSRSRTWVVLEHQTDPVLRSDRRRTTTSGAANPKTSKSLPSSVVSQTCPCLASRSARLPGSALISATISRRIDSVSSVTIFPFIQEFGVDGGPMNELIFIRLKQTT